MFGTIFAWSIRHDATLHAPGLAIYLAAFLLLMALLLGMRVAHAPATAAAAA
ncbi:hypothetical protein [Phenylobacterium sp.]